MRSEVYGSRSVSVCLSVYDYSRTTGNEAAYERYPTALAVHGLGKKNADFAELESNKRCVAPTHE